MKGWRAKFSPPRGPGRPPQPPINRNNRYLVCGRTNHPRRGPALDRAEALRPSALPRPALSFFRAHYATFQQPKQATTSRGAVSGDPVSVGAQLAKTLRGLRRLDKASPAAKQARHHMKNLVTAANKRGLLFVRQAIAAAISDPPGHTIVASAQDINDMAILMSAALQPEEIGQVLRGLQGQLRPHAPIVSLAATTCSLIASKKTENKIDLIFSILRWLPRQLVPHYQTAVDPQDFVAKHFEAWVGQPSRPGWTSDDFASLLLHIAKDKDGAVIPVDQIGAVVARLAVVWASPLSLAHAPASNPEAPAIDPETALLSGLHFGVATLGAVTKELGQLKDAQLVLLLSSFNKAILSALNSSEWIALTQNHFTIPQYLCWVSFLILEVNKQAGVKWSDHLLIKKLVEGVMAGWEDPDKRALSTLLQRKQPVSLWFKERFTWLTGKR